MQVFIMRGLPGSGKSTYARSLNARIVSADVFFERQGAYSFDPAKLHEAHIWCFGQYLMLLQQREPLIVVDNTNTTAVEIAPYALAAESYGYSVEMLEFSIGVDAAAKRNTHQVPKATIMKMARAMQTPLPKWWKVHRVRKAPAP